MSDSQASTTDHRKTVGEWLSLPYEWRIPVYQRHYSWDADKDPSPIHLLWKTVAEQTKKRLDGEKTKQHYLGAVLVDFKTARDASDGFIRYDVVDGQQRLTTIQIALLALAKVGKKKNYNSETWKKLQRYVFCDHEKDEPRLPRLRPTNFDRDQFKMLLYKATGDLPELGKQEVDAEIAQKSRITAACRFFEDAVESIVEEHELHGSHKVIDAILKSLLEGFDLVRIVLSEDDDAQGIFESLNSYAEPLTTFDLIRNNVFRRAAEIEPGLDEKVFYSPEWQQLEHPYWEGSAERRKGSGAKHIEAYIARMLVSTMKKEVHFNRNEIFKSYIEFSLSSEFTSIGEEVDALRCYTSTYRYLNGDTDECGELPVELGVFSYKVWPSRDFYPVLFTLAGSDASHEEKEKMVRLLESYVVRRGICKLTAEGYNKVAVVICKDMADIVSYERLFDLLSRFEGDSILFPSDEEVREACVEKEFYGNKYQKYVFMKLEQHAAQDDIERGDFNVQSVDHILPKAWDQDVGWLTKLAGVDPLVIERHVHTIGNLTPMSTKRNSKKSNRSWDDSKKLLEISPMAINRELVMHEKWDIDRIRKRSDDLAERICKIWPYDIPS